MERTIIALIAGLVVFAFGAILAATQPTQDAQNLFGFSGMGVSGFVIFVGGACDIITAWRRKP